MLFYLCFLGLLTYSYRYIYCYGISKIRTQEPMKSEGPLETKISITCSSYKEKYIVKNIFKSLILCILFLCTTLPMVDGFFNDQWSNLSFHFYGTIYTSLDLSGLIYVAGLPYETTVHHMVVCVLGFLNLLSDYRMNGYYRSMLIYSYFSIVPFIVNFFLGYRYLEKDIKKLNYLALISYYVYAVSLFLNMLSQILFFLSEPFHFSIVVYLFLYYHIFKDDLKLISFLKDFVSTHHSSIRI